MIVFGNLILHLLAFVPVLGVQRKYDKVSKDEALMVAIIHEVMTTDTNRTPLNQVPILCHGWIQELKKWVQEIQLLLQGQLQLRVSSLPSARHTTQQTAAGDIFESQKQVRLTPYPALLSTPSSLPSQSLCTGVNSCSLYLSRLQYSMEKVDLKVNEVTGVV